VDILSQILYYKTVDVGKLCALLMNTIKQPLYFMVEFNNL